MKMNLKKIMVCLSFLTIQTAFANKDVIPENNFCSPIIDSKTYLTNDFSLIYPRTTQFQCNYRCNVNGQIEVVTAISDVRVTSMEDDALSVVCQGILVKKVSWGYDFDKVEPFYAYKTNLKEIKRWAFQNISQNIKINQIEVKLLQELKNELYVISGSLIMAGINGGESSRNFKEAGEKLSQIADQLPQNSKLLDEAIKQIVVNRGQISSEISSDSLVHRMILTSAAWRIPNHLF